MEEYSIKFDLFSSFFLRKIGIPCRFIHGEILKHSVTIERVEENLGWVCMLGEATQMVLVKKYEACETLWRSSVRFTGVLGLQSLGCSPKNTWSRNCFLLFWVVSAFRAWIWVLVKEEQTDCKKIHGNLPLGKREGFGFVKDTWEGGGGDKRTV